MRMEAASKTAEMERLPPSPVVGDTLHTRIWLRQFLGRTVADWLMAVTRFVTMRLIRPTATAN